jgi:hypothetical protein
VSDQKAGKTKIGGIDSKVQSQGLIGGILCNIIQRVQQFFIVLGAADFISMAVSREMAVNKKFSWLCRYHQKYHPE